MGCVYLLTSPSGKSYVGITKHDLEQRWARHVKDHLSNSWGCALYAAMRKYGPDNFQRRTLEMHTDWGDLCASERRLIRELNTKYPTGYNLTDGGEGVGGLPPEKEAARIAKSAATRTGVRLSDTHKDNLRSSHLGLPSGMLGKKHTLESKQKMSETRTNNWASLSSHEQEKRAAHLRVVPKKPVVFTDEVRAKIIASNQQRKGEKRKTGRRDEG